MITFNKIYTKIAKDECSQFLIYRTQNDLKYKLIEDKFSHSTDEIILESEHNHNRFLPLRIVLSEDKTGLNVKIRYSSIINVLLYTGLILKTTFFLLLCFVKNYIRYKTVTIMRSIKRSTYTLYTMVHLW